MTNPFERHGLDHLSPSSINIFADEPAFWAYKYLLGREDKAGPAAWRGNAVEAGLDHWLYKRDEGAAEKAAIERFESDAMGELSDAIDKERNRILPMLWLATKNVWDGDPPTGRQFVAEHWFDDIEVPFVLKPDYEWPDKGLDLKTVSRMPSEIPPRHARQISLYQTARQRPYYLLYVTEKKAELKQLTAEETRRSIMQLQWYAHTIRRGLSTFSDKMELARTFKPNLDSFYWKNPDTLAQAMEIWNER